LSGVVVGSHVSFLEENHVQEICAAPAEEESPDLRLDEAAGVKSGQTYHYHGDNGAVLPCGQPGRLPCSVLRTFLALPWSLVVRKVLVLLFEDVSDLKNRGGAGLLHFLPGCRRGTSKPRWPPSTF